jgi:hypothetical protein
VAIAEYVNVGAVWMRYRHFVEVRTAEPMAVAIH